MKTIEGTPYTLKTATTYRKAFAIAAPPQIGATFVAINPSVANTNPMSLEFANTNAIVPVSYSLSIVDITAPATPVVLVDIVSPYYAFLKIVTGVPTFIDPSAHRPMAKMIPLIDRLYYNSNELYGYNVNYPFASLSNEDFLTMQGLCYFYFYGSLADALTGNGSSPTITLPVGTTSINVVVTFTYFELQKK